jgi:outer membrane protein TolC
MKKIFLVIAFLFNINIFSQTLEDYIDIALKNNSKIKVKTKTVNLLTEKTKEVESFENTNFNTGIYALTPETRVGSQLFKVGISQKLPWFGELDAKRNVVLKQADIKRYDIKLSEKDIVFQVKKIYYKFYQQEAVTNILKENKRILKIYENMALSALENNRATMSDVLRIRIQKNELHSKMFQNLNSLKILSENFNRLLERNIKTSINVPDSLNVLDILVLNKSVDKHTILQQIKEKEKVYQAEQKVIKLSKKPKISVGIDYMLIAKRSDANPIENGKDIIMPKIGVSIPIFNKKKYQSQNQQIEIKQEILKNEIQAKQTELEIALFQAKLELDNAILTVVATQKNKTEIQRAINVDLKAYETGVLDYDKILRLQLQKIRFELMEIEATKNAFIAKAKIDYLVN